LQQGWIKHLTQLLQKEHNTKSMEGRGWHFFAGLDPEKNMKILPQCQGLLRPSSIEVRVQVLDKKGEDEKMPEKCRPHAPRLILTQDLV